MAKYLISDTTLQGIADAIRAKKGTNDPIVAADFASEILSIDDSGDSTESGECSGTHVIEVTELPTENIDQNAVYLYDGKYYKYEVVFSEIIAVNLLGEGTIPFKALYEQIGYKCELYYVYEKPTTEILDSSTGDVMYLYYVEKEGDIFLYGEGEWQPFSAVVGGEFIDTITDPNETTVDGYYAVINPWRIFREGAYVITVDELPTENIDTNAVYSCNQKYCVYWMGTWAEFIIPSEEMKITENGTYDVTEMSSVEVNVQAPEILVVQKASSLPYKMEGSLAYVLEED